MNIDLEYPIWSLLLCFVVAALFAALLYFRNSDVPDRTRNQFRWLALLRFLSISGILILLLGPILKSFKNETQKPIVVFAYDNSKSIVQEEDSNSLVSFAETMQEAKSDLSDKFDVFEFSFADSILTGHLRTYNGTASDISGIMRYLEDLFSDQNLGGVFLATDGIFNQGIDPNYANLGLSAPVHTILMGDTTPDMDLNIRNIFHNNIAYLNDLTEIQIDVSSTNAANRSSSAILYKVSGSSVTEIERERLRIDSDDFFETLSFSVNLDEPGLQRYRIALNPLSNERNTSNNYRDFFIEVIDARQKILILADSPHPDIRAISNTLSLNENFDIEVAYVSDPPRNLEEYGLLIMHQLPSRTSGAGQWMRRVNESTLPKLFVIGSKTNIPVFNQTQGILNIAGRQFSPNVVQAEYVPTFNYFSIDQNIQEAVRNYPPMEAPFGNFQLVSTAQTLFNQVIGKVPTNFPLWMVGEQEGGNRIGIICGTGFWRWKLYDYLQNEQHDHTNELMAKTVQYLSVKEDKRKFRVYQSKNIYQENDQIQFTAELYNDSYERIIGSDVSIIIRDRDGANYEFAFTPGTEYYTLTAGRLSEGDYVWTAQTTVNSEVLTVSGQFSIEKVDLEQRQTTANLALLTQLSASTSGQVLTLDQANQISAMMLDDENLKPLIFRVLSSKYAINVRWIFGLILLLLALEWSLRRYFGTY